MIVLLIEDNADDALVIEVELENQAGRDLQLVHVPTLERGLQRLKMGDVDVVLTDLGLPDSQGLDTFRRVRAGAPNVPIVVLTGNTDESVGLAAVGEGAQEFLCKSELRSGSLLRTIRFAIQRFKVSSQRGDGQDKPIAMTLAFAGCKGGVGTSTVALNTAMTLAISGKSVVLVELRPYFGTLASLLKLNPAVNLGTLSQMGDSAPTSDLIAAKLKQVPLAHHESGLRILFAPQQVEQYCELEPDFVGSLLQCLSNTFEFIILDLPVCPSPATRAALERTHRIVSVMEREQTCVNAIAAFLELIKSWNCGLSVAGIVVVNRAVSGAPLDVHDVARNLNVPIVGMLPPAVDACHEAIHSGRPLVLSFPEHLVSDSLRETTRRLTAPSVIRLST